MLGNPFGVESVVDARDTRRALRDAGLCSATPSGSTIMVLGAGLPTSPPPTPENRRTAGNQKTAVPPAGPPGPPTQPTPRYNESPHANGVTQQSPGSRSAPWVNGRA